ncbi:MAG: DnaT-like ssDNA-binding protein [Janthinobacterium lividum]
MPDFYGTVTAANAYHQARGNTAWIGSDAEKTAALLRASLYVDSLGRRQTDSGAWNSLFSGTKDGGRAQSREWPRIRAFDFGGSAIDAATVPIEVEQATYEAALREVASPGSLNPDYVPASLVKREKSGPWEEEYFAPGEGTNPNQPLISIVLALLAPVMRSARSGMAIMVV